jgi:hypothetical protein
MKDFVNLNFGFSDAENYKRRENKELFNRVFVRNQHLEELCEPSKTFLIGEKGTGKTAYAIYLSNNNYKNTLASIRYIRETEYKKFLALKKEKHLDLSDYTSIWKALIHLLISQQIKDKEKMNFQSQNIVHLLASMEQFRNIIYMPFLQKLFRLCSLCRSQNPNVA